MPMAYPTGETVCTVDDTPYSSLKDAIEKTNEGTITLTKDVTEDVVIPEGKTVTLNLGTHKITNQSDHTITVKPGANLTITGNGTVDNVTHARAAIWNEGTVELNGGTYTRSKETGASAGESGRNSYYNIVNHGRMTINQGVSVTQTGHFSSLVENGWYNGNENTGNSESVMVINGGTFSGGLNTIKNDDYGNLTINRGNFTNTTQASLLNWNKATINGGTFESNASDAVILNGYINDTMDQGILNISGGTFTATGNGDAIQDMDGASQGGKITITSGNFTGDLNFNGNGSKTVQISGATINGDVMAADGVTATIKNSQVSGTVNGVESDDATTTGDVAEINGAKYATLQEAIKHVNKNETITILKDIPDAVGISVPEGKNFTIDFDGHTYTLVGPGAGSAGTETNAFQLLKDSTITFKDGTIRISEGANNVKRIIQNYANLTLENMQIYAQNQAGGENYPLSFNNGNIVFKGNTSIYTSSPDNIAFDVYYWTEGGYTEGVGVTFEQDYTGTINGTIIYDSTDGDKGKLEINGNGHFGKIDCSSGSEDAAKEGIEISGGTFTESVKEYVVNELNYELNSNGLYSYHSTLEEAKQAAGRLGGTIINRTSNSVTIVPPSPVSDDTDRPSGSHNTGSSSSSGSNSNVSYTRDPEQDKREAEENMWKRAINKINSARDGSSLKIYTGIVDEIPDYVLDALREHNVTVTFYNQDGDEVTIPAGMAPKSLRDSWTFKQLGNYVLSLDEVVTEVEETTETTQPATEQNAPADNTDTAKPNPETGDASSSMMAIAAAAASLCGVVLLSKKNK